MTTNTFEFFVKFSNDGINLIIVGEKGAKYYMGLSAFMHRTAGEHLT